MFGLTADEESKLEARFSGMVRALLTEKNPDGFAVAAAVFVVRVAKVFDLVPPMLAAVGTTLTELRSSVDDLIGELQDMRGVPTGEEAEGGE